MISVLNIDHNKFALNGIPYHKNFLPHVVGNSLRIVNTYDSKLILSDVQHFSQYSVNGVVHSNVADLQAALLPIIFYRETLGAEFSQDNYKTETVIDCPEEPTVDNFAAAINALPMFSIQDKEIPTFKAVSTGTSPVTYYIEILNTGKGTYGDGGAIELLPENLKITSFSASADDIEQQVATTIIDLGESMFGPVFSLNIQNPAIYVKDISVGMTIFKTQTPGPNVIKSKFLWVGSAGTYGVGGLESTDNDFEVIYEKDNNSITKAEKNFMSVTGSGELYALTFGKGRTTAVFTGEITEIISGANFAGTGQYVGQRHILRNRQAIPIKINPNIGTVKFRTLDQEVYWLLPGQSIELDFNEAGELEQVDNRENLEVYNRAGQYTYQSDFLSAVAASNQPFLGAAISSGTTGAANSASGKYGAVSSNSVATIGSGYRWQTLAYHTFEAFGGMWDGFQFDGLINLSAAATALARIGFTSSNNSSEPANGVYFECLGRDITVKTANNGVRTSYDLLTITDNRYYHFRIKINYITGFVFEVYSPEGILMAAQTINTNRTNGVALLAGWVGTCTTAAAVSLGSIDYMGITRSKMGSRGALT